MNFNYHKVVLGGTFDLLHSGHKALISKAFEIGKFVTIGITNDQFNKAHSKISFENQAARIKNLKIFLKQSNRLKKSKIIWLNDIFGTTLEDPEIKAIVVSPETKNSAEIINKQRTKKGFKKLDIIVVPFIKDQTGKVISSTRIRNGEINPEGISYKDLLITLAGKSLSENIKSELKKPFGRILTSVRMTRERHSRLLSRISGMTITVGDITTKKFLEAGIFPKLAIVDFLVQRKKMFSNISELGFKSSDKYIKVINKPGQISKSLVLAIQKSLTLES